MKIKTKRRICGVVMLLGFLLLLGTAGASDAGTIPMHQIIWQSIIGLAMFAGARYKGGWII